MKKILLATLIGVFCFSAEGFSVARTWVGIGAGGAGTVFNTSTNWSPAGVPTSADALTINITAGATATISLNASITVGSINMTVSGDRNGILRANGFLLTVNGTANFNAVNYVNFTNYSYCEVDAGNAPGGFVFNGNTQIHTTGSGDTYIGGATSSEGTMTFNANLTIGAWAYTNPGDEPIWSFNGAGAQTVTFSSNYHVKPSRINFGVTNSPVISVVAVPAALATGNYFTIYDGSLNVNNNTIADIGNFDFDPWISGTTISVNSTSTLRIGDNNNFPGFGVGAGNPTNYGTYTISATSTIHYNGALGQSVSNLASPGYGHIMYSGAGTKTSAGNFFIRGDWTNNGTFAHNNNTHTFNGTPNETIGGTSATTFYNLVENKATGTLYMGVNNNRVNNVLTLTAGPLDLNSFTLIIGNSAAAAIVRTSGYIISETNSGTNPSIVQWLMATTTGAHVIPFGTSAGVYIPFTFNKTTATSSTINVSTRPTLTSANTPWANTVTHMYDPTLAQDGSDEAVVDRWWHITCTGATTANITFSYRGAENTMIVPYNTGNIGAQYWGGAWLPNNANIGSAVAVTAGVGTVTANAVAFTAGTFTPMILSSLAAPLPVELVSMNGVCQAGHAHLEWATASETNNSHFAVLRSDNGEPFRVIGEILGNGTTVSMSAYEYNDSEPMNATTAYRIIQYDYNGAHNAYDPILVSACDETSGNVTAFGSENNIVVMFNSETETNYVVSVLDVQGRVIHSENISAAEGASKHVISGDGISTGVYFVQVQMPSGEVKSDRVFVPGVQ